MLESEGNRPYHLHLVTWFDFQDLNTNQDIPDSNAVWTWPRLWRGEKVGKPRVGSISAGLMRYLGHLTQNASLMSESWINELWEQGLPLPQCQISFNFMQNVSGYQRSSLCQTSSMWWSHFADLCIPTGLSTLSAVPSNAGFSRDERSWGLGSNSIYARTWRHFKQVRMRVLFSIKGFVRQRHAGSATKNLGLGQLL